MANTVGEKELRTDWPFTSGLTARTTKQAGRISNLIPTEGTIVFKRNKEGL